MNFIKIMQLRRSSRLQHIAWVHATTKEQLQVFRRVIVYQALDMMHVVRCLQATIAIAAAVVSCA
jgi:hypothetical protein